MKKRILEKAMEAIDPSEEQVDEENQPQTEKQEDGANFEKIRNFGP